MSFIISTQNALSEGKGESIKILKIILFFVVSALSGFSESTVSEKTLKAPEGWKIPLGKDSPLTALDAAGMLFGKGDLENSLFILKEEKTLPIPGTSEDESVLPEGSTLEAPSALNIQSQGKSYVVFLWEGTRSQGDSDTSYAEKVSVLGVFPQNSSVPTDAADVKSDQLTFFGEGALLKLGSDDAFTLINHHANAGQPYYANTLYHIFNGKLSRIAEIFTLGVMSGGADSFREELQWKVKPGSQGAHPDVIASVLLVHAPAEYQEEGEEKQKETRETFEETYTWKNSKACYVDSGGNMDRLEAWNEQHM